MWRCMVVGELEIVTIQESYTLWQKSRYVYSLCSIEDRCLQTVNGLAMWGECVTWIASELRWRHLTHAFLRHICMFGLAWVHVRLALHIFNTNNRILFMFGYSFTFILHLWKLICYFVTSILVYTQFMSSSWDIEDTYKWYM